MTVIFYYDDDTENLLTQEDAEETTPEEAIDELFNLADDDVSYVGFIYGNKRYKIKSDHYDAYKIYLFEPDHGDYILNRLVDFEECKSFILNELFVSALEETDNENNIKRNRWILPDWNKN